jgi:hypothetical protein
VCEIGARIIGPGVSVFCCRLLSFHPCTELPSLSYTFYTSCFFQYRLFAPSRYLVFCV